MRLLFLIIILFSSSITAQDSIQLQLEQSTKLKAAHFWGEDAFQNTYKSLQQTFIKFNTKQQFEYKNIQLGTLYSADILNPLEITLFYKDFNTVVTLDNNLNAVNIIRFNQLANTKNVGFATTGIEQHLWLFNLNFQQVELYNYKTQQTKNIGQPIRETVIDMKSNYNFCWVLSEKYLYQFNSYGSLLAKMAIENGVSLSVNQSKVIIHTQDQLYFLDTKNKPQLIPIIADTKNIQDVFLSSDYLYIYNLENLTTYKLQPTKKE